MKPQFQTLRRLAKADGITIKAARVGDYSKQGIHRLYPNLQEMHDAVDVALRDGFSTIYIHTTRTWPKCIAERKKQS